jgi:Tfp pilus assembly protein PilX
MKITSVTSERGSVLVTALLTITIMTLICATSLYVASQNTSAGMQTASWQQALSGAESAVDQAFNALNMNASGTSGAWTNWKKVDSSSLPTTQPSGGSAATTPPPSNKYNYLIPSNITFQQGVEGNNSVSSWVTIDTAGLPLDNNGNQWYRVRATGSAAVPGPKRVSNQRLDDDLRKLSLIFDRKAGGTVSSPVASRTIEAIAAPQTTNVSAYGIMLRNSINMKGSTHMVIDSFDSSNPNKSTLGQYDFTKQQSHGNVATVNSTGSNLNNQALYGSLAYSGPPVAGIGGVTGAISTPFNASLPATSDPSWIALPVNTYTGVPPSGVLTAIGLGPGALATHVKINGNFKTTGGAFTILGIPGSYIEIWVTGKFQTNSTLTQTNGVHVTWYVDGGNISTGGGSYVNLSGTALYTTFIGVGTGTVSIGGNSNFIAALNAPGYDITVNGSGDFSGSLAGNSLSMVGSGNIHYDEALSANGNNSLIANYAFASWFEDNSDSARGQSF